ncbi:MAG: multidrug efflux transporter permease subunit [Phycisphaerales bacterium]|nr:multidrug efflux transporter permease subunit [Phycisphaerales bacterium]MDB5358556.1 multidrug efflux transporter permease subunit [Phycisphaerales bacterium]
MFSLFFIRRPIVACVLAILIILMGAVAFPTLPVAQYPQISPPVVRVTTTYPGASAQVVADTVASVIEQQVNGVQGMIYMESTSASDSSYTLNVTFEVGTDIDIAATLVQNRVAIALSQLPDVVRRQGVTTEKVSSSIVSLFALTPKDPKRTAEFSDLYLANYLTISVNDQVKRIAGVGDTVIRPDKDYGMRIWLDPDKLKARGFTTVEVENALREQNVQVTAGVIGQPPAPRGVEQGFQYTVATLGRLQTPEQFENIIVRADGNRVVYLKDVARVELGGKAYDTLGRIDGVPSALMVVYQSPDGNSVQVAENLRKLLVDLGRDLPDGLEFKTIYDTSNFVVSAIDEVYKTIFEATALVILVVFIFLGSIRSTLIPIAAIPVSLVGTFFAMKLFGFSLNLPTLFGLILAIGIVVDDAIVVVENVERNLTEHHLPPKEAAAKAMLEVFGPVIGISLVLMAVFLPTAALPGISGQLYRQFALTIAASTFFSAVCALTLSPALSGVILREHKKGKKHNLLKRGFDSAFDFIAKGYASLVRFLVRPAVIGLSLLAFTGACVLIVWTVTHVPTGFVPDEDKGLLITEVRMPDSASQERTLAVIKQVEDIYKSTDGVEHVGALQGFSLIAGNGSNYGVAFAGLKPWTYRVPQGRDLQTMLAEVRGKFAQIHEGVVIAFYLPAVEGIGNAAGFDLRIEDRGGLGRERMQQFVQELTTDGNAQTKLRGVSSAYRAAVPQLFADIDREKAKKLGLSLQDVFSTLSVDLGSDYVNDFNKFGRTWQVDVQADSKFRYRADQVKLLQVRNAKGDMIPLGSIMKVNESMGPDRVIRYNLYPAAAINGSNALGVSSGEALAVVEDMIKQKQPQGIGFEWTALSFQEKRAAGTAGIVFILALTVVYLILAALYESWTMPFAVILSIPLAVLGAMLGLMSRGMDNNIYTQVGLVLLVGLGAKNAILIVEFAKANHEKGMGIVDSVVEAARLRLRPILMTALAFILGVLPLVHATGAGAASRQAIGTAVFYGMLGNTFLGLIFTPVLYVAITAVSERIRKPKKPPAAGAIADLSSPALSALP